MMTSKLTPVFVNSRLTSKSFEIDEKEGCLFIYDIDQSNKKCSVKKYSSWFCCVSLYDPNGIILFRQKNIPVDKIYNTISKKDKRIYRLGD